MYVIAVTTSMLSYILNETQQLGKLHPNKVKLLFSNGLIDLTLTLFITTIN